MFELPQLTISATRAFRVKCSQIVTKSYPNNCQGSFHRKIDLFLKCLWINTFGHIFGCYIVQKVAKKRINLVALLMSERENFAYNKIDFTEDFLMLPLGQVTQGRNPGLVVKGGDSCSRGRGFDPSKGY